MDVGAKAEIHALIQELAERGLAIIMISSELPEMLGMSDRVAVMHAGTVSGVLSRAEATQDKIHRARAGAPVVRTGSCDSDSGLHYEDGRCTEEKRRSPSRDRRAGAGAG